MDPQTLRQIRGAKDLLQDAVEAAAIAIADAHKTMTRKPYTLLARVTPITAPVRAIEQAHLQMTDGVYFAIRLGNRLAGLLAGFALDRLEAKVSSERDA